MTEVPAALRALLRDTGGGGVSPSPALGTDGPPGRLGVWAACRPDRPVPATPDARGRETEGHPLTDAPGGAPHAGALAGDQGSDPRRVGTGARQHEGRLPEDLPFEGRDSRWGRAHGPAWESSQHPALRRLRRGGAPTAQDEGPYKNQELGHTPGEWQVDFGQMWP